MVKQLTRSAVRVYGALSALGKDSGSVLEGLLPFLEPLLRLHHGKKLDPAELASEVRKAYRWNFNADLVEAFVPHLQRSGWIVADMPEQRNSTFTIQMPSEGNLSEESRSVEAELREIAKSFKSFSEELSPLTAIPREVEEFEDILVEWLLYVEAFSEDSIKISANVRPDEAGILKQIIVIPRSTSLKDEEVFLCARFVKHILDEDKKSAEVLTRIASIGLLTEVVQDFVKPTDAVEKTDLVVYLDAPVAMELLSVSGRAAMENTLPVIEELKRIGASLRIFGQSVEEIKNSLSAVLRNVRPTGPTATAMARSEVLRPYVIDVANDPVPFLEKFGVQVAYRSVDQTPSEHQHFTEEQRDDLYGRLRYADNHHAREHDTNITTFVSRQRRGRTSRDIFKSHAVVLTRNGLLAQIVRSMFEELGGDAGHAIPPVVHRRMVATAMWLRTGLGSAPLNIPKRMLLANCERVLAIRPGVVDTVKRLTDALGDEETARQLDLLINQDRSAQVLMDKTLGLSNVVTADNLPALWREMIDPHLEGERQKGLAEVTKLQAESKRRLSDAGRRIDELEKRRNAEASAHEAELARRLDDDKLAIEGMCSEVSGRLKLWQIARIVSAVGIAATFSLPVLLETSPEVKIASFLAGFVLTYLTATGGRLIWTNIDSGRALRALSKAADRRKLTEKLNQFDVGWEGAAFTVSEKERDQRATPEYLWDYQK